MSYKKTIALSEAESKVCSILACFEPSVLVVIDTVTGGEHAVLCREHLIEFCKITLKNYETNKTNTGKTSQNQQ